MGHQQHWTKVRSCFVSLKLIKHQGLQCFSVGLATPFILPRCSTFLTGKDAVCLLIWCLSKCELILRPYQSPTRLLYGSAILNGMGAALLWTSQVQNLTSQTSKNTFTLTGKISCHQLRAAHCRAQRWYLLDSLPDEWSPGVDLRTCAFSQGGRD